MQPYDIEMNAIRDKYPNLLLPPDTFAEYEKLSVEWDKLNKQRNEVIARRNALALRHNQTI